MKRLTSYLVVIATVVAAVAAVPAAHAGNPNAAAVRAIELRSQELGKVCQSATLSRGLYIGYCGTKGAEAHSTAADLRAAEIRGQAIDEVATVRATPTSASFDWADFGIGAGSMLGLVLLAGGFFVRRRLFATLLATASIGAVLALAAAASADPTNSPTNFPLHAVCTGLGEVQLNQTGPSHTDAFLVEGTNTVVLGAANGAPGLLQQALAAGTTCTFRFGTVPVVIISG